MKSKRKIILPNKPVFKHSEPNVNKNRCEQSLKRTNLSNISLQQNLQFFQQHSNVFRRPSLNCGDADTYFRHILRNYDYFDINLFRTDNKKRTKSLEAIAKKKSVSLIKQKQPSTTQRSANNKGSSEKLSTRIKPIKVKKEVEEVDGEIFYSPSSHTLTSSRLSSHTLKNLSSENVTESQTEEEITSNLENTLKNMAEDEEVLQLFDEEEGENEEKGEDEPKIEVELEEEAEGEVGGEIVGKVKDDAEESAAEDAEEVEGIYGEGEEDDQMKEVEKMIQQASDELAEVTEQTLHPVEEEDVEEVAEPKKAKGEGDGSFFKFDPAIDAAVLRELEEAEKQAKATAKVIYELKTRVTELLKKEKHTEAEARELEAKNKELKAQMILFEDKTKRIQFLLAQTNLFDKMISPDVPLQVRHKEDVLPKIIVCGVTENNIPKLILCDDKKRKPGEEHSKDINIPMSVVPKFAKRLSDSYTMQERLAAENADLEGTRYKLQSDLLSKDQTIEYLQRKLCTIQSEMRMLCKENAVLNDKIQQVCVQKREVSKPKKATCGKDKGPCPADIEGRLCEYSETTKLLEKQLCDMENDVKAMQCELTAVQAEREHLEQHKKIIVCPPMCLPHPCAPPPCSPCIVSCTDAQLRELREQYNRLQDDFKAKVTEVGFLRADNEKLKACANEIEEKRKSYEERIRELERSIKTKGPEKFGGQKEQLIEMEQQLTVTKQRFREAQDELEEIRAFVQDQEGQLNDYRCKYLEAQQEVEEQKRHIDILELDANRVNEQVNMEIQRVKNQFQEKLQELLPLPDLLKSTQIKLQEVQQMHLQAERNNESLNRDLQLYKDKILEITERMNQSQSDQKLGEDEKQSLSKRIEQMETRISELEDEKLDLKEQLTHMQDMLDEVEHELQTKVHEIVQLEAQLESVREESARQVSRNKERCETVRRTMQVQIADLERQLTITRAQARTVQKDRDEIRQKMQMQINNLHENFADAQMRIRSLQGHVNFLKESYQVTTVGQDALLQATGDCEVSDYCMCGK